jgi:(2Fe-2S) ferredoxin
MRYDKHLFICTNQKPEGKACCGEERGMALVEKFREVLKEKGLNGKIRAQKSGCLDACKYGPAMVIYPEGTYYKNIQISDVERIVEDHILNNKIVGDLELVWENQKA